MPCVYTTVFELRSDVLLLFIIHHSLFLCEIEHEHQFEHHICIHQKDKNQVDWVQFLIDVVERHLLSVFARGHLVYYHSPILGLTERLTIDDRLAFVVTRKPQIDCLVFASAVMWVASQGTRLTVRVKTSSFMSHYLSTPRQRRPLKLRSIASISYDII